MKNLKKHIGNENLKNKLLAPKLEVPTYILNQEGLKNGAYNEQFDDLKF